jgi:hypothetical protein
VSDEAKMLAGIRPATFELLRPVVIIGTKTASDRVVPRALVKNPDAAKHMLGLGYVWVDREGNGHGAGLFSLNWSGVHPTIAAVGPSKYTPAEVEQARRILIRAEKRGVSYDAPESTKRIIRWASHVVGMADDAEYSAFMSEAMSGEEKKSHRERLREIWTAIIEANKTRLLPIHQRIKAAPRIRGCGAAARRAGF